MPIKSLTKTEQAYSVLRRSIVEGELAEDTPLEDTELIERYGFGRTPLREAIKRLSDEQFIISPPHRTSYVRGIGVLELARLYEARHLLEEPVALLAAQRATAKQVEELGNLCDQIQIAVDQSDVYASVELDHRFHLAVAQATGNRFLSEAVNRLNCGSLRLWYLSHDRLGMRHVNDDHRALHECIANRNGEEAVRVISQHIKTSYQRQIEHQQLEIESLLRGRNTERQEK